MHTLELLINRLRKSIESETLKHQVTSPTDIIGFMVDIRALEAQSLQEIRLIAIENRGRSRVESACESAEIQVRRITAQAVNEAEKLGRVVVAA